MPLVRERAGAVPTRVRESHRDNGCLAVAVELVRDVMGSVRTIGECLKLTDIGDSSAGGDRTHDPRDNEMHAINRVRPLVQPVNLLSGKLPDTDRK